MICGLYLELCSVQDTHICAITVVHDYKSNVGFTGGPTAIDSCDRIDATTAPMFSKIILFISYKTQLSMHTGTEGEWDEWGLKLPLNF